ncbi:MAG: translation initiation factor IF-2 [Candidatus Hydrothermarchaeota archaeon]
MKIRQIITSVLGHVDHGKTTLLDKIRGTAIAQKESGGITQHIGATEIPIETIKDICKGLIDESKYKIRIPGLLFIDTPGHEAFTTLRKRGGALADLALLVVDINEGIQPQTIESLNILKHYRTPFVVAANKIDMIYGWQAKENSTFLASLKNQSSFVREKIDEKLYSLVGELYKYDFSSERFDRVKDFTREIAIVPVSAKSGEGIPELLMVLIGLAQQYLTESLKIEVSGPGKGTVMEVKEEHGLGTTLDVILYDGSIKRGDKIAIGGLDGVVVTKVKALLKPRPLDEIRDPRFKFQRFNEVYAASGVKIVAKGLENVIAGAPLLVVEEDLESVKESIISEIEGIRIETESQGVVLKADTLGSLEATIGQLRKLGIPIRKADVGDVSKRDVIEAYSVNLNDPYLGVIIAFNVRILHDALEEAERTGVKIFQDNVIYRLIEDYERWVEESKLEERRKEFEALTQPGKIQILANHIFRASKPAIVGIEVISGSIRPKYKLMQSNGSIVGEIRSIQEERENISIAKKGDRVAIAIEGAVVGRNINEGDFLYVFIPNGHLSKFDKFLDELSNDELGVLQEIKSIIEKKRKGESYD